MILAYLLLSTGLIISSVAIYYSVVGLTAIFSAAAVPFTNGLISLLQSGILVFAPNKAVTPTMATSAPVKLLNH